MHIVSGLFTDSEHAGMAVAEIKQKDLGEITIVAKDEKGNINETTVNEENNAVEGAVVGGALGALLGLLAGVTAVTVPGLGALIIGGTLLGAMTGGLVGALTEAGIPEDTAKIYEEAVGRGQVLLIVNSNDDKQNEVMQVLNTHHAEEIYQGHDE